MFLGKFSAGLGLSRGIFRGKNSPWEFFSVGATFQCGGGISEKNFPREGDIPHDSENDQKLKSFSNKSVLRKAQNEQTGPSSETRSRERPEKWKCTTGDNQQPRPSKVTRPIEATKAKDTEKMSEAMINKNKDKRDI